MNDKRVNVILQDGRYYLHQNPKLYDILEADALRPKSSYSGNLYSVEYFKLLKSTKIMASSVVLGLLREGNENLSNILLDMLDKNEELDEIGYLTKRIAQREEEQARMKGLPKYAHERYYFLFILFYINNL